MKDIRSERETPRLAFKLMDLHRTFLARTQRPNSVILFFIRRVRHTLANHYSYLDGYGQWCSNPDKDKAPVAIR